MHSFYCLQANLFVNFPPRRWKTDKFTRSSLSTNKVTQSKSAARPDIDWNHWAHTTITQPSPPPFEWCAKAMASGIWPCQCAHPMTTQNEPNHTQTTWLPHTDSTQTWCASICVRLHPLSNQCFCYLVQLFLFLLLSNEKVPIKNIPSIYQNK